MRAAPILAGILWVAGGGAALEGVARGSVASFGGLSLLGAGAALLGAGFVVWGQSAEVLPRAVEPSMESGTELPAASGPACADVEVIGPLPVYTGGGATATGRRYRDAWMAGCLVALAFVVLIAVA